METALSKQGTGIAVAVGTALIMSFYPSATRAVYAHGGNAVFIILFSTFWRAAALAGFCSATDKRLFATRRSVREAAINGLFQSASIVGILGGMAFLPGPVVITIIYSNVLMIYLYTCLKGEETFTWPVLAAVLCAFAGISFCVDVYGTGGGFSGIGLSMALMGAVASATRVYRYARQMETANPAVVGAETFIFVLLFTAFLPLYALPQPPLDATGWAWACLGAGTLAFGNFGMFYGIGLLGGFRFSFYAKLEPIFGAVVAVLTIHEVLAPMQYAGMAMVAGALFVFQMLSRRGRRA